MQDERTDTTDLLDSETVNKKLVVATGISDSSENEEIIRGENICIQVFWSKRYLTESAQEENQVVVVTNSVVTLVGIFFFDLSTNEDHKQVVKMLDKGFLEQEH